MIIDKTNQFSASTIIIPIPISSDNLFFTDKTDKWDVAISANNLSSGITWDNRVTNYSVQDSYEYNGLDFSGALTGGDTPDFEATLDSLEQIFQPEESSISYKSNIPRQIYLSGLYSVNDRLRAGAVFFNQSFRNVSNNVVGLHANYDLIKWFNVGVTYSMRENTFDNIGMSLMLHGRHYQLFAISDNVIDLIDPTKGNAFAIRLGGNLFF